MASNNSSSSSSHHNYKMFMCFNRKFKINETQPPFDVVEAFNIYTNKGAHMNPAQLHRFMVDFQGEDHVTENDAVLILDDVLKCRRHLNKFSKHVLTLEDFFFFLFSDDFNPPLINQVHQDMTAPMQQYFIFTGHNSYLTGNQLSSDCSDVPIIKALHKGVRVIELDIWPNSAKDDVNVLHGRTLTTPVPLIKCLKSIKEHAFAASQYPVIITLEDHLTPDLQAKVAKMVTEVFGEMLFCPEAKHFEQFPSPEELKFRIILSTKPPKEYLEDKQGKEKGSTSPGSSGDETPNDAQGDSESDQDEGDNYTTSPGGKSDQVGPHYKHLIAIHAGKPKNGTRQALRTGLEKVRRLSLSEQALDKAAENYGPDVVRFTQKNFLRIYPKGTRIRSSNYEPLVGWQHGAQMVAFNMQGYGKSLWLMNGMFRSNGSCGYVKKPDFLMTKGPNDEVFDPKAPSEVKKTLKVRVYMGDGWRLDFSKTHFDTFSPPDFYVKLRILGVPADVAKDKTKVIEDEWTPVWDQEFKFPLTVPELALLQFEVREYDMSEKDDFGGQACLPISELKTGFRSIRLYDRKGEKLPSVRLLVKFQFT